MGIKEQQEEIINEFKNLNNWMEKYNYLITLGKKIPPMDEKYKTDENLIKGCQVKTWFRAELREGRLFFEIDSTSPLVKGIISLLLRVFSGQKPEDIINTELYFIDKIGLENEFSPLKANSLFKLLNRIKAEATFYAKK